MYLPLRYLRPDRLEIRLFSLLPLHRQEHLPQHPRDSQQIPEKCQPYSLGVRHRLDLTRQQALQMFVPLKVPDRLFQRQPPQVLLHPLLLQLQVPRWSLGCLRCPQVLLLIRRCKSAILTDLRLYCFSKEDLPSSFGAESPSPGVSALFSAGGSSFFSSCHNGMFVYLTDLASKV